MGTLTCAWCGKELRADLPGTLLSHGMCIPCSGSNGFFPVEEHVTVSPDAESADPFPSGWLIVDRDGVIQSFRWSDEPLAGSSWRGITGTSFFADVAPWPTVRRLERQFRHFVMVGEPGEAELAFLFRSGEVDQLLFFELVYDPLAEEARITVEQIA